MIPRDLGEVSESNLKSLIRDDASENKRREFKALLNLDGKHKQKHKAHLVQEISGFANEEGGDFIVGVAEDDDGIAEKLIGMELDSVDNTKEQWGNILRDNIDPPIPSNLLDMKAVEFQNVNGNRRHGIIIRTEASWRAPHRETLTHRFYGRSPSGKQELDMGEIRDQFLETERFTERVKGFKDERVDAIRENSAAVPLVDGPLLALHVVPSNAFVRGTVLDPKSASRENDDSPRLMANRPSGSYARYNTDGYLMASTTREGDTASKYVQTFRTGPIESVTDYGVVDKSNTEGKNRILVAPWFVNRSNPAFQSMYRFSMIKTLVTHTLCF